MEDAFRFADELGPFKLVHVYRPSVGLKAVIAIDNIACGPAIGGVRMARCQHRGSLPARAMTLKNAATGLPHGGGKSVIFADPKMALGDKERLIRSLAAAIGNLTEYIPGPDMGTDKLAMGWIKDEIGRAVGLPCEIGGITLDEIGATGFGLVSAIDVARQHLELQLAGARIVIQGFGSVGKARRAFPRREGGGDRRSQRYARHDRRREGIGSGRADRAQGGGPSASRLSARAQARGRCSDRHSMRDLDPRVTAGCHPCRQCCAAEGKTRR